MANAYNIHRACNRLSAKSHYELNKEVAEDFLRRHLETRKPERRRTRAEREEEVQEQEQAQIRAQEEGLTTPLARVVRHMVHNIVQCLPGSLVTNQLLRASKRLKTDPRLDAKKQNKRDSGDCRLCVMLHVNPGKRDIPYHGRLFSRLGVLLDSPGVSRPITFVPSGQILIEI